jgi:hypothetical protein
LKVAALAGDLASLFDIRRCPAVSLDDPNLTRSAPQLWVFALVLTAMAGLHSAFLLDNQFLMGKLPSAKVIEFELAGLDLVRLALVRAEIPEVMRFLRCDMQLATVDPRSGSIQVDEWSILIHRGLAESDVQSLAPGYLKKVVSAEPERSFYESATVRLGGRDVQLVLHFCSGLLSAVNLGIVGLEWWTRKGHQENIELSSRLFPNGRRFTGGSVQVKFEQGCELYDGGSTFYLCYEPPETNEATRKRTKTRQNTRRKP